MNANIIEFESELATLMEKLNAESARFHSEGKFGVFVVTPRRTASGFKLDIEIHGSGSVKDEEEIRWLYGAWRCST